MIEKNISAHIQSSSESEDNDKFISFSTWKHGIEFSAGSTFGYRAWIEVPDIFLWLLLGRKHRGYIGGLYYDVIMNVHGVEGRWLIDTHSGNCVSFILNGEPFNAKMPYNSLLCKGSSAFRLCFVDPPWAWFTTQSLEEQWGDDWDQGVFDAGSPYSPCWHNEPKHRNDPNAMRGWRPGTQEPYSAGELCQCAICRKDWNQDGTPKWRIKKVGWEGPFNYWSEKMSVQAINKFGYPWLEPDLWVKGGDLIYAGCSIEEFAQTIRDAGGIAYKDGLRD